MATISRAGITGGGTIQSSHITNIIDALDGTSTTTTVVATGSFSGSLVGALTGTASFATSALSASYALTASYAINGGGGGGGGIFALTGSVYSTTNNLNITGSLSVTAGVTASIQGTASFADTADQLLVSRTLIDGSFFPVIADSSNAASTPERLKTTSGITINPFTNLITGATLSGSLSGSVGLSGSFTVQNKHATVNLSFIAGGDGTGTGQFILPTSQTTTSPPAAGSVYWNDVTSTLYIYSATSATWVAIT